MFPFDKPLSLTFWRKKAGREIGDKKADMVSHATHSPLAPPLFFKFLKERERHKESERRLEKEREKENDLFR